MRLPANLRDALATHGFESHEDYGYALRCLFEQPGRQLRCLAIEGDCGRRKTAFANALSAALAYPHSLYQDLAVPAGAAQRSGGDDSADADADIHAPSALDRLLSDACAYSEAEPTLCVLDQLQTLDFAEHIRLHRFVQSGEWHSANGEFIANPRRLTLFLISEEPLYHSLQKHSFRLWVRRAGYADHRYRAGEFALPDAAQQLIDALDPLFAALNVLPTHSEYARILDDIHARVGNADELAQSIYGWTEGISPQALHSAGCRHHLTTATAVIEDYLRADVVEMASPGAV